MTFSLSAASETNLVKVHPKLADVVRLAIKISKVDFKVVEGVRSREQMMINYGKGRTAAQCTAKGVPARYAQPTRAKVTWLNNPFASTHAIQADGFGHAVDLLPAPYDWKEGPGWRQINDAMMEAARRLGVKIRWGRNWDGDDKYEEKGETDGPHFELVT